MHPVPTNQWLVPPANPSPHKGNLVVYSSCHTWSMVVYLQTGRQDIADKYNVYGVVIHLARDQGAAKDPRFAKVFADADVILHHPLDSDRWDGLRVREFKLKPSCRMVTMESPQAACVWPVLSGLAEVPTLQLLERGATTEDVLALFEASALPTDFENRFKQDIERMWLRDKDVDLKSHDFILKHWQTVKMFSTCNHPTFHVYVWMLDQFAALLGFERRGEDEALRVKTFAIEGDGHYPETRYEFEHYGFRYPQRYSHCMGGSAFYHNEIRLIAEKYKASLPKI